VLVPGASATPSNSARSAWISRRRGQHGYLAAGSAWLGPGTRYGLLAHRSDAGSFFPHVSHQPSPSSFEGRFAPQNGQLMELIEVLRGLPRLTYPAFSWPLRPVSALFPASSNILPIRCYTPTRLWQWIRWSRHASASEVPAKARASIPMLSGRGEGTCRASDQAGVVSPQVLQKRSYEEQGRDSQVKTLPPLRHTAMECVEERLFEESGGGSEKSTGHR